MLRHKLLKANSRLTRVCKCLLVDRVHDVLDESYLQFRDASLLAVHHLARADAHRLLQIALGEELAVDQLLQQTDTMNISTEAWLKYNNRHSIGYQGILYNV